MLKDKRLTACHNSMEKVVQIQTMLMMVMKMLPRLPMVVPMMVVTMMMNGPGMMNQAMMVTMAMMEITGQMLGGGAY